VLRFAPDIVNKLESYMPSVAAANVSGALGPLSEATLHVASMCFMSVGGHTFLGLLSTGYASGSKEQKRLYSLMCTLLKFSTMMGSLPCWQQGSKGLLVAAIQCDALAKLAAQVLQQASGTITTAAPQLSSSAGTASAQQSHGMAVTGPSESAAGPGSAIHQLPNLVLIGRCCLQWAKALRQSGATHKLSRQQQQRQAAAGVGTLGQTALRAAVWGLRGPACEVQDWLVSPGISVQLSVAGYDPQLLLHVGETFQKGAVGYTLSGVAEGLVESLEAYGRALTAFAKPGACNNPSCCNVSGPSERSVVSGRSCKCAGCHTAYYCSTRCQHHHWKQHKPVCKALVAATAAAAAAAAAASQAE